MARPTKKTTEVVEKLRYAFAIGATIDTACSYAGINKQTYYNWIGDDRELLDQFEGLRNEPILKAMKTIVDDLDNVSTAKWYLERKVRKEFSTSSAIEIENPENMRDRYKTMLGLLSILKDEGQDTEEMTEDEILEKGFPATLRALKVGINEMDKEEERESNQVDQDSNSHS